MKHSYILFFLSCTLVASCLGRSVHRPKESWYPTISVHLEGTSETAVLSDPHLDAYPFFKIYDQEFFNQHLLPDTEHISFRYDPESSVQGKQLNTLVNQLLEEIATKKKTYTNFTIVQDNDFNRRKACGLLIVRFKEYPFILKLFIETPHSFINHQCKGFEPVFFFYMGNGVNRHLSGFTRIKNLQQVNQQIAQDPYWAQHASTPRKWFWLPKKSSWFAITGTNMGDTTQHIRIPSTYAVIADAIESERKLAYTNSEDTSQALKLCNYLGLQIDPNIRNFILEKSTQKMVIVDTEHFPTIVGLREPIPMGNYYEYFSGLVGKCAKDMLFSTKKDLRTPHKDPLVLC